MSQFNDFFSFLELQNADNLDPKYKLFNVPQDDDFVFKMDMGVHEESQLYIVFSEEEAEECREEGQTELLVLTPDTIEEAYLGIENGYRGEIFYIGYVKVGGYYHSCDFVGESAASLLELPKAAMVDAIAQLDKLVEEY